MSLCTWLCHSRQERLPTIHHSGFRSISNWNRFLYAKSCSSEGGDALYKTLVKIATYHKHGKHRYKKMTYNLLGKHIPSPCSTKGYSYKYWRTKIQNTRGSFHTLVNGCIWTGINKREREMFTFLSILLTWLCSRHSSYDCKNLTSPVRSRFVWYWVAAEYVIQLEL